LIEASTKFNYQERVQNNNVLFVNLEDAYQLHQLYWKQFCLGLLKVPIYGEEILDSFNDESHSTHDVYKIMRETNPSLDYSLVKSSLEGLVSAGFLDKDDYETRKPNYFQSNSLPNLTLEPDWQQYWQQGVAFMQQNYPDVAERWVKEQLKEDKLKVFDPLKMDYVDLVNQT
jgi:hypothetical protein